MPAVAKARLIANPINPLPRITGSGATWSEGDRTTRIAREFSVPIASCHVVPGPSASRLLGVMLHDQAIVAGVSHATKQMLQPRRLVEMRGMAFAAWRWPACRAIDVNPSD